MNTFKKVVLSGTPHERGVTYGRECRELIDRTIGDYERYFNNKPNLSALRRSSMTSSHTL